MKILKLILSIVGLLLTVRLMWYFGIALDEKWTLSEFKSFLSVSEFIILFTFLYLIIRCYSADEDLNLDR